MGTLSVEINILNPRLAEKLGYSLTNGKDVTKFR